MFSPIHHTFGPLTTARQALHALGLLLGMPTGNAKEILCTTLSNKYGSAMLYASGREGLLSLLRTLDLKAGAEIIIQGYTCIALPNAIHAAGGTPVYIDIKKDSLNLDPEKVEAAITHRTRAVICQHTFGIPADTQALSAICKQHNILLIEDCAHIMPDKKGPNSLATHGEAILFSFGRDKAISGISGGAICTKNPEIQQSLEAQSPTMRPLSKSTTSALLLYPILYTLFRPIYTIGIGKALLKLCGMVGLLPAVTSAKEKGGYMDSIIHTLPRRLAALALTQVKQVDAINGHRRMLTSYYLNVAKEKKWDIPSAITSDMPLQKFPLYTKHADEIRRKLKQKNIYLDDGWSGSVICPRSADKEVAGYDNDTTPIAEEVGQNILSLPTHPQMTLKNAEHLVQLLTPLLT